jgi:hypothetical protein
MILAPNDWQIIVAAERRHIDQKLLNQDFLVLIAALENDGLFPLAARRPVGHRVITVSDQFAQLLPPEKADRGLANRGQRC